jgi:uncharacterized ferritin-like protein (DUF455 family)
MLRRRRNPPPLVPYDMFDAERTAREVSAARSLERVYHAGQDRVWDGREKLSKLVEEHGGVHLPERERVALSRVLATIFWGELAAWKVAADLAARIEPLEAKMAATAQAHDEARHFYVLHDYLELLGYTPGPLPPSADAVLQTIVGADSLAKKVVGMQLMVEPIALTIFQMLREHETEPVLCSLLRLYERDEARHVAFGVNYLPSLLAQMSKRQLVDYWAWQVRMIRLEIAGMRDMEDDFRALGFPPREVFRLGQSKQLLAARMLAQQMGHDLPVTDTFRRFSHALVEYNFPEDGSRPIRPVRLVRAMRAAVVADSAVADALTEAA